MEKNTEKVVICTGNKVYRPPLPSTYKGEISEDVSGSVLQKYRENPAGAPCYDFKVRRKIRR